jgi:hypothetical protein
VEYMAISIVIAKTTRIMTPFSIIIVLSIF